MMVGIRDSYSMCIMLRDQANLKWYAARLCALSKDCSVFQFQGRMEAFKQCFMYIVWKCVCMLLDNQKMWK